MQVDTLTSASMFLELGEHAVQYNADNQWQLNLVLAMMILSISLDIHWRDFQSVVHRPKSIFVGLFAQFTLLPALTTLLTLLLNLPASIELGMILVAACPGGALSNLITHLAKGNTALSLSMTTSASALAIIMLPVNFMFWSQINPDTQQLLQTIKLDNQALIINLLLVLALPLMLGLIIRAYAPHFAQRLHFWLNKLSIVALLAFIIIAVSSNFAAFKTHFLLIFSVVLLHNATALAIGFATSKFAKLNIRDSKAVTFEVGMQNSALAIAITFTQFSREAGMALISAFWGTWHIVSGLFIAMICRHLAKSSPVSINGAAQ